VTPVPELDERLEQLEIKLGYLERANQDFGDVVYRQQQALDRLEARVARLIERIQALEETSRSDAPADPPPPHY
jgi:SlyX protein